MKYRKKPVEIEAVQLNYGNADEVALWCGGMVRREAKVSDSDDVALFLDIATLEGVMTANRGDFVIRGVKGEFYPCKPGIFEATYEEVR